MMSLLSTAGFSGISITTIVFCVVMLLFLIFGIKKGFARSAFGLIACVGGVFAAMFLMPPVAEFLLDTDLLEDLEGSVATGIVSAVSFIVIFFLVWLVLKFIFRALAKVIDKAPLLGGVNRLLGGVFGLVSGLAFCLIVTFILGLFSEQGWMQTVLQDAAKDPVASWLFNNNLIERFLTLLADKFGGVFESLRNLLVGNAA